MTVPEKFKEIYCGWGRTIKSSEVQETNLMKVLQDTMSAKWIEDKIAQVRAIPDPQQRQDAKAALLPYFVMNRFKGNYRKNENFEEARFIVADFDHIPDRMVEVTEKLKIDERVLAFFRSPSNDGVKIIFALEEPINNKDFFSKYYEDIITTISKEYGVEPDMSCKDPARAVFFSHDPEPHFKEAYRALKVVQPKGGVLKGRPPKQETFSTSNALLEMFSPAGPGSRTHQMTQLIGMCINKGMSADLALHFVRLWNAKNTPPHEDKKLISTVQDMYARYQKIDLPFDIIEKNNQYYRFSLGDPEKKEKLLTTFRIEPRELLVTSEGDVLHCDVISSAGEKYEDIIIEPKEWNAESLHNTIGHMDCTVLATDPEVKVLKMFVNSRIPIRKNGTRIVGLNESQEIWVTKGSNITKNGKLDPMETIPYDKGGDAFYNKISYIEQSDSEYLESARKFYDLVLKINEPQAVVPFVGWNFIAPMRKVLMELREHFPILFVPGTMGSGKTSTAKLFMKLHGYTKPDISSADMRKFPMLKALSSTNGIPIFIDEFKQSDMTDFNINDIHRYIRKSYDGGVEAKGHSDQTTTDYHLLAPWCLLGEWSIKNPAERERMVIPRFSAVIKTDETMQAAYRELFDNTELRGFMPRYIQWLLNQDIRKRFYDTEKYCKNHFKAMPTAIRIMDNLVIMSMGINLFLDYGKYLEIPVPDINLPVILNGQLTEITGTPTGQVESSFDQLISEMSKMSIREKNDATGLVTGATKEPWYMLIQYEDRPALAIRFSLALPKLKEFARRTSTDIDILDEKGYRRMMNPKELRYLLSASHAVRFSGKQYRCVVIDVERARGAGVDLEGFEEQ